MKKNSAASWIFLHSKKFVPGIILLALLSCINALGFIFLALISKNAINYAVDYLNKTLNTLAPVFKQFLFMAIVVILMIAIRYAISSIKVRIQTLSQMSMKRDLLMALIDKKYSKVYKTHSGEMLNRFTSDIDIVVNCSTSIIPDFLSMLTKIIAGIAYLIIFTGLNFALIILAIGIALIVCGRIYSKKFKALHKKCQETSGVVRSFLQECFMNLSVIKTFGSKAPIKDKLDKDMKENYRLAIKRNFVNNIAMSLLLVLFTGGYYAVLGWGAVQIAHGIIAYGELTALLQIVSQIRTPFFNMSGSVSQVFSALASAERLEEIELIEKDEKYDIEYLNESFKKCDTISFENLSFSYDEEIVLDNTTFDINIGSTAAITGISGAGKSTLFKIMLGLFDPNSGKIKLKGNGVSLDVGSASRPLFSYVPQGNMILSGTIKENMLLCNPNADDNELVEAAKTAEIFDFIDTLPDKFETIIGERGTGLSEGQVQRIAIARALLLNTPIVLLDECTSALDEQTEKKLIQNISKMKDKTVIFISHRAAALSICDSVIHLENKKFKVL